MGRTHRLNQTTGPGTMLRVHVVPQNGPQAILGVHKPFCGPPNMVVDHSFGPQPGLWTPTWSWAICWFSCLSSQIQPTKSKIQPAESTIQPAESNIQPAESTQAQAEPPKGHSHSCAYTSPSKPEKAENSTSCRAELLGLWLNSAAHGRMLRPRPSVGGARFRTAF